MKRLLLYFLVMLVLVAWWATSTRQEVPAFISTSPVQTDYPADFQPRLKKLNDIHTTLNEKLPEGLCWESAQNHPVPGNPEAVKGGRVRISNAGPYPAHFLKFGGTVQFFHQNLNTATDVPLLQLHPLTKQITAGVASAWAKSGNTYYLQLNREARYNNGCPVRAADYLLGLLLQAEQKCTEYETIAALADKISTHGDSILSIRLKNTADILTVCQHLTAAEPGFYSQFDSRFRQTYAQRIPPTTGAYKVKRTEKGRLIELERVQNWWGEKTPLGQYRFNANTIEFHFLTSEAQVWEFFLRKKLDALQTRNIAAWQERLTDHPEVSTLTYDAEYPMPPYGIAINTRTVCNIDIRKGLLQAMDMNRAIQLIWRGEAQRLTTFSSGYGKLSPEHTPEYSYSPEKARASFFRAGYSVQGSDGILRKADGTKLSVKLLYTPNEKISTLISSLISSAATCGAEIIPEAVPWQTCQRQLDERKHELVFWAVPAPATPQPELFFAKTAESSFSPFSLDSQEMEQALEEYKKQPTADNLAHIDKLVYQSAIWLPGWKENRVYLAHHSHIQIPISPWCYDALDAHMFWVLPSTP